MVFNVIKNDIYFFKIEFIANCDDWSTNTKKGAHYAMKEIEQKLFPNVP